MDKSQKKCSTNHDLIKPKDFVVKMGGLLCPECRLILYQPSTPMFRTVNAYQLLQIKQLRPLGEITLELEKVLKEMTNDHDLQWGEVLGLVHTWLSIHAPNAQEEYVDGDNPMYYYGPKRKS